MADNALPTIAQGKVLSEKRATVSSSPEPIVNPSAASDGIHTARMAAASPTTVRNLRSTTPSDTSVTRAPVSNAKRPPPFSRKLTKSLFIRPADKRGPAPGYIQSIKAALTYSWINVLLICNPVAWGLHYAGGVPDGATFAVSLLGVIPLAGLLGFGTESVALYTGDALGGLINASLGNATEFIIAILLLVKCQIRVVQASLLGGLLSNLLLVLGMAFVVGGLRFSEQEFMQTAAQLNTSLMTLAVIALIIPTVFAFALEAAIGEEQERGVILEMSRGSSVILIAVYIAYMVFQLYSHSHLYNPDSDYLDDDASSNSSNSRPASPVAATPHTKPSSRPPWQQHPSTANNRYPQVPPLAPRRAHSLPFGSAAALGGRSVWHHHASRGRSGSGDPRSADKAEQAAARSRGRNIAHAAGVSDGPSGAGGELRKRDVAHPARADAEVDVESARPPARRADSESSEEEGPESPEMNIPVSICVLVAATGLTYLTAEALTDSLEGIGRSGGVTEEWLGLILLAVVGNAAEHVTAVFVAYRNKVDLALAVSVGSCIQISLFVIPVLVLISWAMGKPLSLLFDPLEVVTLFLSVLLVRFATEDGRTHYMSGVALLGTYILIAFSFWYYPSRGSTSVTEFQCT